MTFRNRVEKTARFLTRRLMWTFVLQLLVWSPLVLLADRAEVISFYLLALPGLAAFSLALNLPLAHAVFTAFRMDEATRRNHALEHATINVLRARGLGRHASGEAACHGFRIAGIPDRKAIGAAFEEVQRLLAGGALPFVSPHCGSNLVTAQALGIGLLAAGVAASLALQPPLGVRVAILLAAPLVLVRWRRRLGNWVQRRYFMRTDFAEVSVRSIEKVRPRSFERAPVHFVRTVVWA